MTKRIAVAGVITTAFIITWVSYASAGLLTINFPTDLADKQSLFRHNSTADGFRVSPNFHYDIEVIGRGGIVPGIGWDGDSLPNPDYLGPPTSIGIYIDENGSSFGLVSIESIGSSPFLARSSKGGMATIPGEPDTPPFPVHFDFIGPEWQDIQWVVFSLFADNGAPTRGFDQLVVFVTPGPSSLGLLGLGTLILGWRLRSLRRVLRVVPRGRLQP
jgi:hypothetical protein